MGTDKLMEEIRALGGTMGRKNWKSPKSGNDDVSKVLHEADDFMGRKGWRLPEREAPPEPEAREQTQISVLAEEANAFMDRSGWTLDEAKVGKYTEKNLLQGSEELRKAARYVSHGSMKNAAYSIQDAFGSINSVISDFGITGHPLKAAQKAFLAAEPSLDEAALPPAPVKSPEKAYRLSVTLARKQPLRAAKYAIYGSILMAKKTQNKRLMVALSKAYQIVEEEVEKAEA
jgi:hypothetical protein